MRFRILFLIVFFICSFGFASNPYDSKLTELAQRIEKTDYQTQQRILKKLYIHAHEHTNEDMREIVRNFIAMLSLKENDMSNYATKINAGVYMKHFPILQYNNIDITSNTKTSASIRINNLRIDNPHIQNIDGKIIYDGISNVIIQESTTTDVTKLTVSFTKEGTIKQREFYQKDIDKPIFVYTGTAVPKPFTLTEKELSDKNNLFLLRAYDGQNVYQHIIEIVLLNENTPSINGEKVEKITPDSLSTSQRLYDCYNEPNQKLIEGCLLDTYKNYTLNTQQACERKDGQHDFFLTHSGKDTNLYSHIARFYKQGDQLFFSSRTVPNKDIDESYKLDSVSCELDNVVVAIEGYDCNDKTYKTYYTFAPDERMSVCDVKVLGDTNEDIIVYKFPYEGYGNPMYEGVVTINKTKQTATPLIIFGNEANEVMQENKGFSESQELLTTAKNIKKEYILNEEGPFEGSIGLSAKVVSVDQEGMMQGQIIIHENNTYKVYLPFVADIYTKSMSISH